MSNKKVMKNFRITEAENKRFHQSAEEHQMKESEYFRFLLSQKPKDYPEIVQLLKQLINEVNHIGHNINQVAKSIHSGYLGINDEKVLIAYMKKINMEVKKVADLIGNQ
jgi:hypothetical protein